MITFEWTPTRLSLRCGKTRWLSPGTTPTIGWDAQFPRIFTRGVFELTEAGSDGPVQFVAISTHFDHVGQKACLESAKILRGLLEPAPAEEWGGSAALPTILCGDFNSVKLAVDTFPTDSPFAILTSGAGGYTDACSACPAEGRSWNGQSNPGGSTIHKFKGWILMTSYM